MEIKFEINDEMFDPTFKNALENLSLEQKQEILLKGFKEYIQTDECKENFKNVFFEGFGYYNSSLKFSEDGNRIVSKAIMEDKEFKDSIINLITELMKDKGKEILIASLKNILLSGLYNDAAFIDGIRYTLVNDINCIISEKLSNMTNNQ